MDSITNMFKGKLPDPSQGEIEEETERREKLQSALDIYNSLKKTIETTTQPGAIRDKFLSDFRKQYEERISELTPAPDSVLDTPPQPEIPLEESRKPLVSRNKEQMEELNKMGIDTSSIFFNYTLINILYNNTVIMNYINTNVDNLINKMFQLIKLKYRQEGWNELDIWNLLKERMFSDLINEQGISGMPLIKDSTGKRLVEVTNLNQFLELYIPRLNLREKMSLIKRFWSSKFTCFFFEILIQFSQLGPEGFNKIYFTGTTKTPLLNDLYITNLIVKINTTTGISIKEFNKCFSDINGTEEVPCTASSSKRYYELVQDNYNSTDRMFDSPITICWLWHSLVYGYTHQDLLKLPGQNYVKNLISSYESTNDPAQSSECMGETFKYLPLLIKLSNREKKFITSRGLKAVVERLFDRPPWTPPICYQKLKEPNSFLINLLKRNKKFSVSNISGHQILFNTMAEIFNIDLSPIILAGMIYMVPYNHSITEIVEATRFYLLTNNLNIPSFDENPQIFDNIFNINDLLLVKNILQNPKQSPLINNPKVQQAFSNANVAKIYKSILIEARKNGLTNTSKFFPLYTEPLELKGGKRKTKNKRKKTKQRKTKKSFKLKKTKRKFK